MAKKKMTTHHRKPKSLGGTSESRNVSKISAKKHAAWHTIVGNANPWQIAHIINKYYLDPDYRLVVRKLR